MSDQRREELAAADVSVPQPGEGTELDVAMEGRAAAQVALSRVTAERDGLLELVHDGVWIVDDEGATVKTNPRLRELLGATAAELSTLRLPDFVPPTRRSETEQLLTQIVSGEKSELALQLRNGSGRLLWVDIRAARYDGGVTMALSDRTEVHEAENELRVVSSDLAYERALLDAVGEALIAVTADGRIAYFNPAAEKLSGWTIEEVVGRPLERLAADHVSPERIALALALIERGKAFHGEVDGWTRERSHVPMALTVAPVTSANGEHAGMVAVAADLSEKHDFEERLRQAQKLEALGRLASGVAHDFNNLLTAIHVNADLMRAGLSNVDHREMADEILNASIKGAELTKQLLAFGRENPRSRAIVRLADIVEDLLAMLQRLLPESIELVTALADDSGYIEADPTQIAQLIMNLVVNARDAMPRGGQLYVGVRTTSDDDDEHVTLVVRDSGVGMEEDTMSQIFKPFFTTKGEEGTGIGLATVFGIVQQNKGSIRVGSRLGEGSTFTVDFPQVKGISVAEGTVDLDDLASPERPHRILICEDEEPIRRLLAMVLRHHGYEVAEAGSAEEAIALAGENARLDLIISDLMLPEMSGPELIERLRAIHSDLDVLMMSGHLSMESAGVGCVPDAQFIRKPFRPHAMIEQVALILDDD